MILVSYGKPYGTCREDHVSHVEMKGVISQNVPTKNNDLHLKNNYFGGQIKAVGAYFYQWASYRKHDLIRKSRPALLRYPENVTKFF